MIHSETEQLDTTLASLKTGFIAVIGFSFAVNLLMLASPLYMLQIYDRVLTSRSMDTLILLTAIVGIALLTMAALEAVRTGLMTKMSGWLDKQMSGSLLMASIIGTLRYGKEASVQGLRDLATVRGFLTGPGIFPVMDAPWAPIYLAFVFMIHPILGWVALGGVLVLFLIGALNEWLTRDKLQASGVANIRALNQANAAVRNADVIEAMGLLPNLLDRWHKSNDEGLQLQETASHRSGVLTATTKFIRLALQTAMLGGGAYLTIAGEMTAGGMIAASILMGRALSPVEQAINSWRSAIAARAGYNRIQEQLEHTPKRGQAMPMPAPSGALSVEGLSFAFPNGRSSLLKNINFELQAGEMLGMIGPSGCGKTTLSRLILGNLQPGAGYARLDGIDVSQWEPEDRGQYIGYLPQDVELFSGTVRENIARMGEGDPEQVIAAARSAGIHEMISRMPHGYDTPIGEAGQTLSGGERQRIALARALYGEPQFIVLDEPNASLDSEGEKALLDVLHNLKEKGVTTLIIAHRPAVLEHVDKILIVKDGSVNAFGPRDEVLERIGMTNIGASHGI